MPPRTVQVIVVHGIGQQKVGSTASGWAGAFERGMRRQSRRTNVVDTALTSSPARVTVQVWPRMATRAAPAVAPGPGCATTLLLMPVLVARALTVRLVSWISRGLGLVVTEPSVPAAPPVADGPEYEVRFVEAHWADAFPQPTPQRVLRWLFIVGPSLALFQAAAIWQGRKRGLSTMSGAARRSITALLPIASAIVLLALAAPLVTFLVLLLLVASWAPIGGVRKAVASILGVVANTIGDAFLFVADPVSRGAIVSTLVDALTTAAEGPSDTDEDERAPVVLLAHSQGAAVAHRALTDGGGAEVLGDRLRGVITVGSGLGRLHDIQGLRVPGWTMPVNVIATSGFVLFLATWWTSLDLPSWVGWVGLGVAIVSTVLLGSYWRRRARDNDPPKDLGGLPWLDIWAPTDLVPNGRAIPAPSPGYDVMHVPGDVSVLRDHTQYRSDDGEVMPAISQFILGAASPPPGLAADRPSVRGIAGPLHPYAARDLVVVLLRLVPPAVAVTLVVTATRRQMAEFGHWLLVAAPDSLSDAADSFTTPIRDILDAAQGWWREPPDLDLVVGAAAMLGLGVVAAIVVRWLFAVAQSWETGQWLRRDCTVRWGRGKWVAALLVIASVSAAAGTGLLWLDARARWTPGQVTDAYVRAVGEGSVARVCNVVGREVWTTLPAAVPGSAVEPDSCATAVAAYLDLMCAEAATAFPDASMTIAATGPTRVVEGTWAPETEPRCEARPELPMLLPAQLERASGTWQIARVCPAGSSARPDRTCIP